jgi:hypothetical protein
VEVDKDGIILRKSQDSGQLPKLVWPEIGSWPIENRVPKNIVRAAIVTDLIQDKFQLAGVPGIDSGSVAGMTLILNLKSGEKIRLSLAKDPVGQLARLQVVLNRARIEGKAAGEIDMRFDNPVVR